MLLLHDLIPMVESKLWSLSHRNLSDVQWLCDRDVVLVGDIVRKTFALSRKYAVYSSPINLVPLLGGKIRFGLPFPIFDLVHLQSIRSFGIQMTSCFHEQLLPGNLYLPIRETAVTRTAHYPENLVPVYNFSARAPCLS